MAVASPFSPSPPAAIVSNALQDWWDGTSKIGTWWTLAWYDILLRYRRSMLGPLWLTISMGALLLGMGPLYAMLFNTDIKSFFPHLALGVIFWTFISGTINDSCTVFTAVSGYLKHSEGPISLFAWRSLAKQVIQFAHQILLFVPIAWWFDVPLRPATLLVVPGFALLILNLHAIEISLGIVGARFRDVGQIVTSITTFLMFLTPVIWLPDSLPQRAKFILNNPFAQMLALVREPLLGKVCPLSVWTGMLAWTAVNVLIAAWIFSWKRRQVVYWV
jgi:lipopolysaccharide transport system permease protein